nr:50S ribosomal protein L18P [uncultured archaeon]
MKTIKSRRRKAITNYSKRILLLKSARPRLVLRKSNKYVVAQYVVSKEAQDKVLLEVNSKKLNKFGWPEKSKSIKNLSAFYLTGLLIGKEIQDKKLEEPILDLGMMRTIHKSNIFGFIKGLIDSGIKISCKKEALPDEERIKGEHLTNKIPFEKIKIAILGEKK